MHIAISGDLGSGKSTVARVLAQRLGWPVVATGEIQRSIARELSVSTLEANLIAARDGSIDRRVDSVTMDLAVHAEAPMIFDSRMAWHFLPNSLRVRLVVDPGVAADRVLTRGSTDVEGYESAEEVHRRVFERSQAEVERFQKTYGVDITDFVNFDLVIDASDLSADEIAGVIVAHLDSPRTRSMILSPRRIVPCIVDGEPAVMYWRPFLICQSHQASVIDWLSTRSPTVTVPLDDVRRYLGPAPRLDEDVASQWESSHGLCFDSFREWVGRFSV